MHFPIMTLAAVGSEEMEISSMDDVRRLTACSTQVIGVRSGWPCHRSSINDHTHQGATDIGNLTTSTLTLRAVASTDCMVAASHDG